MDTLVQQYSTSLNKLIYNHHSITGLPVQNHVNPYQQNQPNESILDSYLSSGINLETKEISLEMINMSQKRDHYGGVQPKESILVDSSLSSGVSSEIKEISSEISSEMIDMSQIRDNFEGVLKYIDQVLMGEDVQNTPCMFHQSSALQAAEKSLYDVLGEKYPPPSESESESFLDQPTLVNQPSEPNLQIFHHSTNLSDVATVNSPAIQFDGLFVSRIKGAQEKVNHFVPNDYYLDHRLELSVEDFKGVQDNNYVNHYLEEDSTEVVLKNHSLNGSRERKIPYREDNDYQQEEQSRKQLASCEEEFEQIEIYDKFFYEEHMCAKASAKLQQRGQSKETKGRRIRDNRQDNKWEIIDLTSLLTQCAKAVQSSDIRNASEILKRIRQHSSPNGDDTERLAHYFANAIEARLAGNGIELYTNFNRKRISAADILKAYQAYVKACPFHRMSNIMADKSIVKLAKGATRLHIIDFGILYGFQWPCFIQEISRREGGPPKLRITGIDFPQPGFRPAERVEATGNHLARYCEKFNVPFEYNAIAKNWDTVKLEDLKIEKDEMLVVNCLYRLRNVPDVTVDETSPRDAVLDLIKRINPDMFVHGVLNGTYNAPFFITRFREAMFHFSSWFDMLEATELRKDKHRLLFEQEVFARDAMNVIACEGTARIERPETYREWQYRNMKAGFRQLPLHKDLMKEVSAKVRLNYHKEFLVDEERNWMLQGWKGRVLYALSFWKPVEE